MLPSHPANRQENLGEQKRLAERWASVPAVVLVTSGVGPRSRPDRKPVRTGSGSSLLEKHHLPGQHRTAAWNLAK